MRCTYDNCFFGTSNIQSMESHIAQKHLKTVKDVVQRSIDMVTANLRLTQKELCEANLNADGTGGSECFEINVAFEEIMDGLAVFQVYADKM